MQTALVFHLPEQLSVIPVQSPVLGVMTRGPDPVSKILYHPPIQHEMLPSCSGFVPFSSLPVIAPFPSTADSFWIADLHLLTAKSDQT